MFICNHCLKNYTNFAIPMSYGPCEDCGQKGLCADIPSGQLRHMRPWEKGGNNPTEEFCPKTDLTKNKKK